MMWRTLRNFAPACLVAAAVGCQAPPAFNFPPYGATQVAPPSTGSYGRSAPGVSQRPAGDAYYSRQSAVAAPADTSLAAASGAAASAGISPVGDWRTATSASLTGASLTGASLTGAATGVQNIGQTIPVSAISPIESTGAVATASSASDSTKEVVRIVEPSSESLSASAPPPQGATAGGMPVNDGTRLREPRLFSPPPGVIAISQAPAAAIGAVGAAPAAAPISGTVAGNPSRDMRGLSAAYPVAQVSAETPVVAPPAAAAPTGAAAPPTGAATASATTATSPAASTASAAPLGWRVKDGLK